MKNRIQNAIQIIKILCSHHGVSKNQIVIESGLDLKEVTRVLNWLKNKGHIENLGGKNGWVNTISSFSFLAKNEN